jgi:hypothetical protein
MGDNSEEEDQAKNDETEANERYYMRAYVKEDREGR